MLKSFNRVADTIKALDSPAPTARHIHKVTIFPESEQVESSLPVLLSALVIALVAFVVAFSTANNPALAVAYDSGHYLASTQLLVSTILSSFQHLWLTTSATMNGASASALGQHLLLDGPILPGLGALIFTMLGHVPQGADWRTLVAISCFAHACSTALVFYLSLRLSAKKTVAAMAGFLWALYPAAVLSCNSFVSEPLITTLLLVSIACLERITCVGKLTPSSTRTGLVITAGVAMACVFVSKPALGPLLALITGFALWNARRSFALLVVTLLLGASLIEGPWIAYTTSIGTPCIASQRAPAVNIVKGSDVTADGWNTFPDTTLAKSLLPSSEPITAYASIAKNHSAQLANLTVRKLERLWINPWNDFRAPFLQVPIAAQMWWHRLLLISAVVALCGWLSQSVKSASSEFIVKCGLCAMILHAIYLPFEACPRYAFTAMPLVIVLAASLLRRRDVKSPSLIALTALVAVLCSTESTPFYLNFIQVYPLALGVECAVKVVAVAALGFIGAVHFKGRGAVAAVSLAGIWIVVLTAHLLNSNESREFRSVLKPGQSVTQDVSSVAVKPGQWVLLLIDGGHELEKSATITVNGHDLSRLTPLSSFSPVNFNLNRNFYEFAGYARKAPHELRQWRAAYVPNSFLNRNGINAITVKAQKMPVTIYGAMPNLSGNRVIPSIDYFSPALQFFKGQPLELRPPRELLSGKRNDRGSYRIFFLSGVNPPYGEPSKSTVEQRISQIGSKPITVTNPSVRLHTRLTIEGTAPPRQPIVLFLRAKLGPSDSSLPGSPILIESSPTGVFQKELILPPGLATSLTATLSSHSSSGIPSWTVSARSENLPLVGLGQTTVH